MRYNAKNTSKLYFFMTTQANNPLHGVKLADILTTLVDKLGWEGLSERVNVRCFKFDPSIKSSLTFLRKTPWAREQVEHLYLEINNHPIPVVQHQRKVQVQTEANRIQRENKSMRKEQQPNGGTSVNAHIWGKN